MGGDAWEHLQYANRYITPAMPGLLVLCAMAIDYLLRERSPFRVAFIQGSASLFLIVGLMSATAPVTLGDVPVTPLDAQLRMARAVLTMMPVVALPLLFMPSPNRPRR